MISRYSRPEMARIWEDERKFQRWLEVGLAGAIETRAFEHKNTVMIGRTHGMHAEPMTFGLKLALWHGEVRRNIDRLTSAKRRVAVGKLSGAVGTFAHLDPDVEAAALGSLGLEPVPIASQVV